MAAKKRKNNRAGGGHAKMQSGKGAWNFYVTSGNNSVQRLLRRTLQHSEQ